MYEIVREQWQAFTSDNAWLETIEYIRKSGYAAVARSLLFQEVLCGRAIVDMARPILTLKRRKLGYRFMAAEAAWIINGDARLDSIRPYAKAIEGFSDDGLFFNGAYGPMVLMQLPYILRSLNDDRGTRQAVLTVWRPSPGRSKDIPCTISCQWIQRGEELHCIYNMRSSDLWLGAPYDWFNFSMLTAYILLCLRQMNPESWGKIRPGLLHYSAGSCHIYEKNLKDAIACLGDQESHGKYKPLNLDEFRHPSHLLSHLWKLADGATTYEHDFALETRNWK